MYVIANRQLVAIALENHFTCQLFLSLKKIRFEVRYDMYKYSMPGGIAGFIDNIDRLPAVVDQKRGPPKPIVDLRLLFKNLEFATSSSSSHHENESLLVFGNPRNLLCISSAMSKGGRRIRPERRVYA